MTSGESPDDPLQALFDLDSLAGVLTEPGFQQWIRTLKSDIRTKFRPSRHGDLESWLNTLEQIRALPASTARLQRDRVGTEASAPPAPQMSAQIRDLLMQLHPWRKGPYQIYDIHVDCEWRSDYKWARLKDAIRPLEGKTVLDVGCGNGYHCWRMAGDGARVVVGIDPSLLFVVQFQVIRHFLGQPPGVFMLPLGIQDVASRVSGFDHVFSMGILYHRKSPIDHLYDLLGLLRPGGQLVLETLVIEGPAGQVLVPDDRYARMRNVWFLPSCPTLQGWLRRVGFRNVECIEVCPTRTDEQRSTEWMRFHSLRDFLDPEDPGLTVEGLPAPRRAVFQADAPA